MSIEVHQEGDVLKSTQKVAIEAIRSQSSPSRGPYFAWNWYATKHQVGYAGFRLVSWFDYVNSGRTSEMMVTWEVIVYLHLIWEGSGTH